MTPTLQACRNCGAGAPLDAHFCPQCTKILPLPRQADYFSFLGLPRKLIIAADDLEQRFRKLSRQFHPDFFHNATTAEKRASLERSSYLNDAYRTLKQPGGRVEYLLKIEGLAPKDERDASRQVPPALLEEVFALNEELDEIREQRESVVGQARDARSGQWRDRLERARQPIEARRVEHEAELQALGARWDALMDAGSPEADRRAVLESLRDRFLEKNYIANLLAGIEREMSS
ncbi:MAG TPA: Fe-S protein assembly co-chaperone HscB [Vicinamibacterales bacterium]